MGGTREEEAIGGAREEETIRGLEKKKPYEDSRRRNHTRTREEETIRGLEKKKPYEGLEGGRPNQSARPQEVDHTGQASGLRRPQFQPEYLIEHLPHSHLTTWRTRLHILSEIVTPLLCCPPSAEAKRCGSQRCDLLVIERRCGDPEMSFGFWKAEVDSGVGGWLLKLLPARRPRQIDLSPTSLQWVLREVHVGGGENTPTIHSAHQMPQVISPQRTRKMLNSKSKQVSSAFRRYGMLEAQRSHHDLLVHFIRCVRHLRERCSITLGELQLQR
ncbi:hypothetical protein E2P81_ATG05835 [Venturia nashicola]|uniref:Uncharacterized protein n=1 Tax=Venturia nashicola TaxID=86259 RepID=A0A4Z1P458_9PEZI|nr:hypothetical protein E6O75_ATG05981 [Venturia nashicola]TLD29541.1 hypothetical protein E2P81_ATG05835 [Venturia nashicola]